MKLVGEYLEPTKNFISQSPSAVRVVQELVCLLSNIDLLHAS